ncbi:hypothetical protein Lalb_Chr05g0218231 [Lupinus albus]|uniref:Uncharacterized protein n=1 Tax=Lupinus albus TaxID=3870 RepID=A0A6A4QJY9_LUPAL|nr:hypothetical protein Lalb_Chr05g0218231 [Lupinus albus]
MSVVAITRRDLMNNFHLSNSDRISGRLIPKRGQVKFTILMAFFHSLSSFTIHVSTYLHSFFKQLLFPHLLELTQKKFR